MTIRAAKLTDISAISAVEQASQFNPWKHEEIFASLFNQNDLIYVIEKPTVCGWIIIRICLDEAEILNIAIDHTMQGHGLGQELLAYALQKLPEKGIKTLFLEVRRSNLPAIHVYQKAGFKLYAERKDYYTTHTGREDALLFRYDFC